VEKAAFGLSSLVLMAFLFLTYSRAGEFVLWQLHLPLLTGVTALLFSTPQLSRVLLTRPGTYVVALTLWLMAATPFSVWPGGSAAVLQEKWVVSFLSFVFTASLLRSARDCRRAVAALGLAGIALLLLVLLLGVRDRENRLQLPAGTLGNSNYLAMHLLMTLPFMALAVYEQRRSAIARLVGAGLGLLSFTLILSTGSRAALVAIVMMVLVGVMLTTGRQRVKLLTAVLFVSLVTVVVIPTALWERLSTTWAVNTETTGLGSAIDSTMARRHLIRQAMILTLEHPVFGVGPGMFGVAENTLAQAQGEPLGSWHDTHNAYAQLSSEAGIPAVTLYLLALGWCIRQLLAVRRAAAVPGLEGGKTLADAVLICLSGYLVVGMFANVGYDLYFPTLTGLAYGLSQAYRGGAAPAPSPVPARGRFGTGG
jgi:O-antigen ligase